MGDFGIVSKFNQQAPFAKVAVLLNSYLSAVKAMDTAINVDTFAGRQEVTARPLNAGADVEEQKTQLVEISSDT